MLKIKLSRIGKKDQPQYRVLVVEAREKNCGKCVESLGNYMPLLKDNNLKIDSEKYASWLKKGAQPTDTVKKLVAKLSK